MNNNRFHQLLESTMGDVRPFLYEAAPPSMPQDVKKFQDWMDQNHPNWIKDADGKWKNIKLGDRTVGGRGYGEFGPSTRKVWSIFGDEYLTGKKREYGTGNNEKLSSCSPNDVKALTWSDLYKKLVNNKMINNGEPLLIVWGPTQTLYYTKDGKSADITDKVSTGAGGFGNVSGQKKTSTGLLKVVGKKSGKDYEVMVSKSPTGVILGPNQDSTRVANGKRHLAEVLTGILELDGLESCNKNTFSRRVYVHGTNREGFLGTKKSGGCVRVSNRMIKQLLSTIDVGTKVYIYPGE